MKQTDVKEVKSKKVVDYFDLRKAARSCGDFFARSNGLMDGLSDFVGVAIG